MGLEKVADGVWLLRGDFRGAMNIYFLEDGDGVVQFDAGTKAMRKKAQAAGERARRDASGSCSATPTPTTAAPPRTSDAPVFCHPDEVADAESDAAIAPYMDLSQLPVAPVRWLYPFLLRRWDGGAVKIAGTVAEGDEVAGFRVIHFPGHAPGLIGLWRESDRVALVSDVVYLVDSARLKPLPRGRGQRPPPRLGLGPREGEGVGAQAGGAGTGAWSAPGTSEPLRGENLRATLERAAEKY